MKRYLFTAFVMALFVMGFSASNLGDDIDDGGTPSTEIDIDGIIRLDAKIGEWDAAYVTEMGYFCYKADITAENEVSGGNSNYSALTYMSEDGGDYVSLISNKNENIPTQLVSSEGIVYFSFPNDSILELLYDDGKGLVMLDSIAYTKNTLPGFENKDDAFKAILSNAALLLKKNTGKFGGNAAISTLIKTYAELFEQISIKPYITDDKFVAEIEIGNSGDYQFTITVQRWYDDNVTENVYNVLSLWTGKATFKVGGSSCTLSGTVFCPSYTYNDYGTYGIICDADQSNLTLGNAEYEGTGYQDKNDLSFSVDFRGFKPNTTYYYRAYYKFNSSDHGNLVPKYGNPTDDVIYDTTIKSFTTGDNILTVDVVMCIDVTGSMGGIINTVKNNAIEFYDLFNESCTEEGIQLAALNTQVIAFRDKNVDREWLNISKTYSLPVERDDFNTFVNGLYADGGGDTPESGLEALDAAFDKEDWGVDDGYHRQVVILWTDAPYLINSGYSGIVLSELEEKWNAMPSGRRLVLFAPYGYEDPSYSGDWGNLDDWTNLIHETDLTNGFNNFEYILKSIIGELTSKGRSETGRNKASRNVYFRPN